MQLGLRHSVRGDPVTKISQGFDWEAYWSTRYPSALTLTVDSDTQITATHTNNGTQDYDYISYEISPNDLLHFSEHTTAVPGTTTKALTGLTANTLYYVRIRYYKG